MPARLCERGFADMACRECSVRGTFWLLRLAGPRWRNHRGAVGAGPTAWVRTYEVRACPFSLRSIRPATRIV